MPSLGKILHRRDKPTSADAEDAPAPTPTPEFKLIRSDTHTQEIITPETDTTSPSPSRDHRSPRRSFQLFARSRASSTSSQSPSRRGRSLSTILHLDARSRSNSRGSVNLPADLPHIDDGQGSSRQEREALWEKRATVLVQHNPQFGSPGEGTLGVEQARPRSSSQSHVVSDANTDVGCMKV